MRDPRVTLVTLSGAIRLEDPGSLLAQGAWAGNMCIHCFQTGMVRNTSSLSHSLWNGTAILPPRWQSKGSEESSHCAHFAIWNPLSKNNVILALTVSFCLSHPLVSISLSASSKVQMDGRAPPHTAFANNRSLTTLMWSLSPLMFVGCKLPL